MVLPMLKDSLSALMDGECSASELDRLLDELDRSPDLGQQWSRLCLAREASEGVRVVAGQACICASVMNQLDQAPPEAAQVKVVHLKDHRRAGHAEPARRLSVWKPAFAFAAAASVGAAAVLLLQPSPQAGLPSASGGAGLASANDGSLGWVRGSSPAPRYVSSEERAHSQMLSEYAMDHSGAAATEGVGGALRYLRFVAHTAEYRQQPDEQP